eukprot:8017913-Ditylum_brightwellii.AAC.1
MDCIMKPFLEKCLPNCGASTDTVTALLKCMTPNQNMCKNYSPRRMHLRWDGHLADFYTDDLKEVMRKEGGRNNKAMNLL